MKRLEVRTSEGVTLELEVAGPGTRFVAALLDGLLIGSTVVAILFALQILLRADPSGLANFAIGLIGVGALLVYIGYHVVYHWRTDGCTPGKLALGIRVLSLEGGPASLGQLLLRGALSPIDLLLVVPLPLGLITIALSSRRQRIGDLVAGTLVVRDERARGRLEPWTTQTWEGLTTRELPLGQADLSRFDREDLVFLRDIVTRRGLEPLRQRSLVRRVAAHYTERLGFEGDVEARQVIREIYLFLRDADRRG